MLLIQRNYLLCFSLIARSFTTSRPYSVPNFRSFRFLGWGLWRSLRLTFRSLAMGTNVIGWVMGLMGCAELHRGDVESCSAQLVTKVDQHFPGFPGDAFVPWSGEDQQLVLARWPWASGRTDAPACFHSPSAELLVGISVACAFCAARVRAVGSVVEYPVTAFAGIGGIRGLELCAIQQLLQQFQVHRPPVKAPAQIWSPVRGLREFRASEAITATLGIQSLIVPGS